MKRITILAATLFALSGLQAQTGIDGVLRNIETNNKEEEDKKIAVGHGECIGTAEDNGAHSETRNETPTRKQH